VTCRRRRPYCGHRCPDSKRFVVRLRQLRPSKTWGVSCCWAERTASNCSAKPCGDWRLSPLYVLESSSSAGSAPDMASDLHLRPATIDEIAETLTFALRYDGRKRVHDAARAMGRSRAPCEALRAIWICGDEEAIHSCPDNELVELGSAAK
jgi:hypothetical protein